MTVAEAGKHKGQLAEVIRETKLDSDKPEVALSGVEGRIHGNLSTGSDITSVTPLASNKGLASNGMKPLGSGFIITDKQIEILDFKKRATWETVIRPYVNGRDLSARSRGVFAIDLFGLTESDARTKFPEVYQHLLDTVRPKRLAALTRSNTADAREYAEKWWLFCKPRQDMRRFLSGLDRYIVTTQTSKHRLFQFLPAHIMSDQKLMVFGLDDPFSLGVMSSTIHTTWSFASGGWLGVGNDSVYSKSKTFDPFPFPDATHEQRGKIAELAEELDATRKTALTEIPGLTMTELYNLREKLRSGAAMTAAEQDRATKARAGIVNRLHEQIDEAVAAAYGWPADLSPSEIVARLVALNAERAAEEKAGTVRWLRPEYQIPRFGKEGIDAG